MHSPPTLSTIGHSNREISVLVQILQQAGIRRLVDVRRFPSSRRWPQFNRDALATSLASAGIGYQHLPDLGGRRQIAANSPNNAWRVQGFRAYADHLASDEYIHAREQLMQLASQQPAAILCAEALWWQCHRRLIADDFVARGWQVQHLMGLDKSQAHVLNEHAVMVSDVLQYPAAQGQLFG